MKYIKFLMGVMLIASTSFALAQPSAQHVIIISFDGGKPSVIQQSHTPVLMRMKQEGAGTWAAFTVVPSITLVSHTSMLTGVQPDKHLIDWNEWIPNKGLVAVPTIFSLAKAKGLTTGLLAGKEKFNHLNLSASLDLFWISRDGSESIAKKAAAFIVEKKPNLTFIHFPDSDLTGHEFGWGSAQQKNAFAMQDRALTVIKKAVAKANLEKDTVIIITADHGGHDKTHGTTSLDDMHIPWIAWGKSVKAGATLTQRVSTCDTAATALWLLGVTLPEAMDGKPVVAAFE